MIPLVIAVFVASLVGSLHCAGMCGGIVTLCVGGREVSSTKRVRPLRPQLLYNFGRFLSYSLLGAISGSVGAAVDFGGSTVGWSRVATLVAGITMLVIGGVGLLKTSGMRVGGPKLPRFLAGGFGRAMNAVKRLPPGVQPTAVGALTALLPCGWLYAFVIGAAGTGSPVRGAIVMAAFWAGTVPIMMIVGVGLQSLSGKLGRHVPRLTAAALMIVGVVSISGRLQIPAYAEADVFATPASVTGTTASDGVGPAIEQVIDHVNGLESTELPCCHGSDQPES